MAVGAPITLTFPGAATSGWVQWPGGVGVWNMGATSFGGATLTLQGQDPNGNAVTMDATNLAVTSATPKQFNWPAGPVRVLVTGTPTAPVSTLTPSS